MLFCSCDFFCTSCGPHCCVEVKLACAYCCMHYFYMTVKLTFIIDLKSTPVKTFPRRGKDRGPGGKLRGLRFLIKSNKISNTKASNSQLLKFKQSKRAWKTMVKVLMILVENHTDSADRALVCLMLFGWNLQFWENKPPCQVT